ncbi:dTDP-4-dehydrorhamnose reductase [Longimicrobium terrae]|uniref:sugar nucleotide-binding protein n=1 Tax=Longimicrobium terrae TaxID=1639882 RepID=UPI0016212AA6|nr:dTDP-4-dehydrorhamnose reductase [Longimicrobium terrae]
MQSNRHPLTSIPVIHVRILITGGAGLLGAELIRGAPASASLFATRRNAPVHAVPNAQVDLADDGAVAGLFAAVRPELVIHTAYSARDGERDIVRATGNVVDGCLSSGARLIHMSTDALLDGESAPYAESARPDPVHEYGRHKAAAEDDVRTRLPASAIIRTSLIVRAEPPDAGSAWVIDTLRGGDPIRLFTDELRCPIAVQDLAAQIWEIAALPAADSAGVWHLAGPEAVSRYALGLLIAQRHGLDAGAIIPVPSASSPAPRPRDLRLLTTRADRALRTRARPVSSVLARAADG